MIKTIVVLIGNSDDKLTQKEWSEYVAAVNSHIDLICSRTHFYGASANYMPWQNVCWVSEIEETCLENMQKALEHLRKYFRQDSIAIVIGDTGFI